MVDRETERRGKGCADNERTPSGSGRGKSFERPAIDLRPCIASRCCDDRQLRNKLPAESIECVEANDQAVRRDFAGMFRSFARYSDGVPPF